MTAHLRAAECEVRTANGYEHQHQLNLAPRQHAPSWPADRQRAAWAAGAVQAGRAKTKKHSSSCRDAMAPLRTLLKPERGGSRVGGTRGTIVKTTVPPRNLRSSLAKGRKAWDFRPSWVRGSVSPCGLQMTPVRLCESSHRLGQGRWKHANNSESIVVILRAPEKHKKHALPHHQVITPLTIQTPLLHTSTTTVYTLRR